MNRCERCGGTETVNAFDDQPRYPSMESNDFENWPAPCPACEGSGFKAAPHYASKINGFTWQILNETEYGLQLILVSGKGVKRGSVFLKPTSDFLRRFAWVTFDDEGIDRNSGVEESIARAMSTIEEIQAGWGPRL